MAEADPFLLLDHAGPTLNGPGEAKGAQWHPHRGFETVTYMLDGELAHRDTTGGGGVICEGETQWMTAGGGIQHEELPTEQLYRQGGLFQAVQLWVNLRPTLKMTTPRYHSITTDALWLLTSDDGGALIRLIAGNIAGFDGPGVTHTPITYATSPWRPGRSCRCHGRRHSARSRSCSPVAEPSARTAGRSTTGSSPCSAPATTSLSLAPSTARRSTCCCSASPGHALRHLYRCWWEA
jgi:redox-sensitive bicupin YhaK (pirin superfamily)